MIAVDCWFLISAVRTLNKFYMVEGWSTMKGAQHVGMFVVIGSSSVSFKRMAEKSKAKARSRMHKDYIRLSVIMFALSGVPKEL